MFVSAKHIPRTEEYAGAIPDWMIQDVGGTTEAANALTQFAYAADTGSFGTKQVVERVQELLVSLGYNKKFGVQVNGRLDQATHLALKYRIGVTWEMMRLKDLVWELQNYVDNVGSKYSNALGAEEGGKSSTVWMYAVLGLGALIIMNDAKKKKR